MALRNRILSVAVKGQHVCYTRKCPVMYLNRHKLPDKKCMLNKRLPWNIHRALSDTNYNSDADESHIEDDLDISDQIENISVRNILYKDSSDTVISQLNNSASVQDVFNTITHNYNIMHVQHICQSVLVLWDLQKIFYKHNFLYGDTSATNIVNTTQILKNYIEQITGHKDFEKLLLLIEQNYETFTLDELTCTLLYLNKMGVLLESRILQKLIQRYEEAIKNCDKSSLPLTAVSRYLVAVNSSDNLWSILVSINSLPIVLHRLEICDSAEDFKLLTICLLKLNKLVTKENLLKYKEVSEKLINEFVINDSQHRTILKSLRFLNQPHWYEYNLNITRKFMYLLQGQVNQLNARELVLLYKVFQIQKEPADMLHEIQESATTFLSEMKAEMNGSLEVMLELLSCVVTFSSPLQRPRLGSLADKCVTNYATPYTLSALFKILYYLKITEGNICHQFWDKFLEVLVIKNNTDSKLDNLLNISQKYIHFTSDTTNPYRYYKFESKMLDLLIHELDFNIISRVPSNFAKIASFILAFCNDQHFLVEIIEHLGKVCHNFNSLDCLNISKGLKLRNKRIKTKDSQLTEALDEIIIKLNEHTEHELSKNLSLPKVNNLLKAYVYRKRNLEFTLFRALLNKYSANSESLSSQILKDVSYCLESNEYLHPETIDTLTAYTVKNKNCILGGTLDKVLWLCYSLGYMPNDAFLEVAGKAIIRDQARFSGLALLQSCLALCYFQTLPASLVKRIFSVEFLETLDEELSNCYAKAIYPIRVRNNLMQLNRAVCLDYPEADVPWFHQKYVDGLMKSKARQQDHYQKKVSLVLSEIFKDANGSVSSELITPYGYHVDFVVQCKNNDNAEPIRTAVMLLTPKCFTNGKMNLKGYYQLKQRHLEILGYKVVSVNYHEWKNFYTQESCIQYLQNKLWSSTNIEDETVSCI